MMRNRKNATKAGLVGLLVLSLSFMIAPVAVAGSIDLDWTTPTINLGVGGDEYPTESALGFFGTPVAIPGDAATRTVKVTNLGTSSAYLRVSLVDAQGSQNNRAFLENLHLSWDLADGTVAGSVPMSTLIDSGSQILGTVPLTQGASTSFQLTYSIPADLTEGNSAVEGTASAGFNVQFQLTQDPTPSETGTALPTPAPSGSGAPGGSGGSGGSSTPGSILETPTLPGGLSVTGAQVIAFLGVAGGLFLLGLWLRRRRGGDDQQS